MRTADEIVSLWPALKTAWRAGKVAERKLQLQRQLDYMAHHHRIPGGRRGTEVERAEREREIYGELNAIGLLEAIP